MLRVIAVLGIRPHPGPLHFDQAQCRPEGEGERGRADFGELVERRITCFELRITYFFLPTAHCGLSTLFCPLHAEP